MIGLVVDLIEIYKKPSEASFTLKRSSNRAILGTPRPLSLKKTRRPTKTPQKLGESSDGHTLKCCRTLLMKGCKGKRRPFSKSRLKEADHLGNGNNIRREKIRTLDSNTRRRSITSSEGFSIRRLNLARAHGIRVPHGKPQIFGATRIPNLANLPLALAWRRKITYWKDPNSHSNRTTESAASSPRLRLLSRHSLYTQAYRMRRPRGSMHG